MKLSGILFFILFFVAPLFLIAGDDYEQEADTVGDSIVRYPSPLERLNKAKRLQLARKTVSNLGFTIVNVKWKSKGTFLINVKGWNNTKVKSRYNGIFRWKSKNKGVGLLVVMVSRKGVYITKSSLRRIGLQFNKAKLKRK